MNLIDPAISSTPLMGLLDPNATYAPPIEEFGEIALPNYERVVARMSRPPLIANDIDSSTKEGEEQLQSILFTRFQGDIISAMPMCACGSLMGGVNHGLVCEVCQVECKNQLERPIETNLWIRTLEGIEKFIAPGFWVILTPALTARGWCLLDWLVTSDYLDPSPDNRFFSVVANLDIENKDRNLNFFYHNFEKIMYTIVLQLLLKKKPRDVTGLSNEDIANLYRGLRDETITAYHVLLETPLGDKLTEEKEFAAFVKKMVGQKECVFTKYIPMPSSAGMVLESNNSGTWFDKVMLIAVDAMYTITSVDKTIQDKTLKFRNGKVVACIKKMAEYSQEYIRKRIMGKKGLFRGHFFGGRQPFSMRCVIGPIIGPHKSDELHLPWAPSVQIFKLHITNKLLKRGSDPVYGRWTPKSIARFIDSYTNRYHPILDEIFEELIAEAAHGGIKCIFNRPPSLEKGSIQCLRVTKIKKDPRIKTISMPINITNPFNADKLLNGVYYSENRNFGGISWLSGIGIWNRVYGWFETTRACIFGLPGSILLR